MIKTAEAVTPAHPDKLCDQIGDLILDKCLEIDPTSRVAIETTGWHGRIFITGEVTLDQTKTDPEKRVPIDDIAIDSVRKVLHDNRYSAKDYTITLNIAKQSPNIANWVDTGGAWDQGIMVGYATREVSSGIPIELATARAFLKHMWNKYDKFRDAKCQVTMRQRRDRNWEYDIWDYETVVVSAERMDDEVIRQELINFFNIQDKPNSIRFFINPCWPWENWGFEADAGTTWRKLAVDNYWPQVEIGGGAFSWKDPTKVDRSWAYIARLVALRTLDRYPLVDWAKVKIAYSIGVAEPVMIHIKTSHTEEFMTNEEFKRVYDLDLTPSGIIKRLDLRKPKYYETAKWGHFGNGFTWDR